MKRQKLSRGKSKRMFSKSAAHVNKKNGMGTPMRGGIRL
ncbi:MAG: hypothetical protein [Arizlama microvirus]|nr:MAG: hypothetical protein [Arizlama microvirus]